MNPKLLSSAEKAEFRRLRNRRRYLKKLRKERKTLVMAIICSPLGLALAQSNALTPEAAFEVLYGRMDRARKAARDLLLVMAEVESVPESLSKAHADTPDDQETSGRCLRRDRQGEPRNSEGFCQQFLAALRVAHCSRRCGYFRGAPPDAAYMEHADLIRLMPGMVLPKRLRRRAYLVRITANQKERKARLLIHSVRVEPLVWQPLPIGLADAIYEGENGSERSEAAA